MAKMFAFFILLIPPLTYAHPGVGIVKDSKGNIFFTDLHQVWRITNGKKTVAVPNVHTHELYIDNHDNLFGEGGYYDDKAVKFYHYLWVLRPNGRIDTVVGMKEQYIHQDFSLSRDKKGNEFYIKRFLRPHTDTNHIYKKTPDGKETILARGNFKNVNWLHPQDDGSLLYASGSMIFRVDSRGDIKPVTNLRNEQSSGSGDDILIWGLWQDNSKNVYAAVFSDKSIKKVDGSGNVTTVYTSKGNWSPLHGTFDNTNKLWVLEGSDQNEVQVVTADIVSVNATDHDTTSTLLPYLIIGCVVLATGIIYLTTRSSKTKIAID